MSTIQIEPGKLGARIKSDATGFPKALSRALYSAGQRGKAYLVSKSPVDRGLLKVAWMVIKTSDGGVEVVNNQPYAGIVERGARPFKVSSAGIFALKGWVMRKLTSGEMNAKISAKTGKTVKRRKTFALEKEAESIAWAIAKTMEKVGIKGKRFVYMALPRLAALMEEEINRSLDKFFSRGIGDK